jgi:CHAT domain-containing protein
MIMSLWKVDDAATQQLMTNFYANWVKSGNKVKAFKLAQQQLMVKYKEPYYWGAFVMVGM